MPVAWVIGGTGLLGSAIVRALISKGTPIYTPSRRFSWLQGSVVEEQLAAAVREFAAVVSACQSWEIYWAAGVGTMGSTEGDLEPETHALNFLIRSIETEPILMSSAGAIAFASSAGAIYAGSRVEIIDENVPVAPTTPYAHAKLAQEDLLRVFVQQTERVKVLLARVTTIYGAGQATGKQQGLLAHIARCIVRNRPIHIYVPFDTIRDYLSADDAADSMVANLHALDGKFCAQIKIIASEQPTTVAEIVSIFKKLARRSLLIFTSASKLGELYSRRVQFHSVEVLALSPPRRTSLLIGISQMLSSERAAYARGPQVIDQ